MFATSAAWYYKPSIVQPRYILTKDSKTIQSIREFSQLHVTVRPTPCYQVNGIGHPSNTSAKNTLVSTSIGVITHVLVICFTFASSQDHAFPGLGIVSPPIRGFVHPLHGQFLLPA
ncbi:hypothetical protein N7530_003974 [Penicillium desertorum]|uniref:Uncharacterized protein n=1 Tax=Penicillium desertorum TaxID=1303715 RepID=A0A9W9WXR5_9EURO|nr:hypothetical protein N7530_003974 [Penicillium desertorum]